MTMRITRETGTRSRAILKLEGSIVAEWAALLEGEVMDLLDRRWRVALDLSGVAFVDRDGIEVLRKLVRAGAEIRRSRQPVASVLEAEGVRVSTE